MLDNADVITGYADNDKERAERYDKLAIDKAFAGTGLLADSLLEKKVSDEYLQLADATKEQGDKLMDEANQKWVEANKKVVDAEDGIITETLKAKLSTVDQQQLKFLEENAMKMMEDGSLQNKAAIAKELIELTNLIEAKIKSKVAVGKEIDALLKGMDGISITQTGEKETELGDFKLKESADAGFSGKIAKGAADFLSNTAANSELYF
jgi:hypothetical protein